MSELKLQIPQEMVLSVVKAQVVAALGKSEQLIHGVVEAAIQQRKDSYGRETIFGEQVAKMIRDVAQECFKEWLAENKEKIRAEMMRQLTEKKGEMLGKLVSKWTSNLMRVDADVKLFLQE